MEEVTIEQEIKEEVTIKKVTNEERKMEETKMEEVRIDEKGRRIDEKGVEEVVGSKGSPTKRHFSLEIERNINRGEGRDGVERIQREQRERRKRRT